MFSRREGVFSVQHFYNYNCKEEDKGETLTVDYFGDNTVNKRKVRLNLTKGTIRTDEITRRAVTDLQLATIYMELVKATRLAADLTINNFTKNKTIQFDQTTVS